MVIPLRSIKHFPKFKLSTHLTPVFTIKGHDYLMETPKMGAVPVRTLKKARKLTGKSAGADNSSAGFPGSRLLNIQQDDISKKSAHLPAEMSAIMARSAKNPTYIVFQSPAFSKALPAW